MKRILLKIINFIKTIIYFPFKILFYPFTRAVAISRIKRYIKENWKYDFSKTIIIFQNSFFDFDGKKFFAGGAERYVIDLAELASKNNYKTLLIQKSKNNFWKNEKNGLTVFGLTDSFGLLYNELVTLTAINPYLTIYSGFINWGRILNKNHICISHGITWDNKPLTLWKYIKLKFLLKRFNKIVSVDTNTISFFRTAFKNIVSKKELYYVPNYVDLTQFKINKNKENKDIKILFPRRLNEYRGYWLCANIMDKIMSLSENIKFDFVGYIHDKKIEVSLNQLIKKYKGKINHYTADPNEMPMIYKNYDISLIPTLRSEGTSLSCLEAQACGNCVIATNIGGLPNLVFDGYNGILINPNETELFEAIKKLVLNENLRKELSKNALDVVKVFDKNIWKDKWTKIINKDFNKNE